MKSKQVLDVQQMQHLQELGLELKETMLYWVVYEAGHENNFVTTKENAMEVIDESCGMLPAYTLQDVLDALPKMIYPFPVHKIGFELWIGSGKIFYANMFNLEDVLKVRYDKELIDAAYELLVWCIENKFVETNKNE